MTFFFLQSLVPSVAVELNAECQSLYDWSLGTGVRVLALGAISWYRNLDKLLSCYVSTVKLHYLLSQEIQRSGLTWLSENSTQVCRTGELEFPGLKDCLQSNRSTCNARDWGELSHRAMGAGWRESMCWHAVTSFKDMEM